MNRHIMQGELYKLCLYFERGFIKLREIIEDGNMKIALGYACELFERPEETRVIHRSKSAKEALTRLFPNEGWEKSLDIISEAINDKQVFMNLAIALKGSDPDVDFSIGSGHATSKLFELAKPDTNEKTLAA